MLTKVHVLLAMLASTLLLEGCYTPLIEGAQQGYDAVRRDPLQARAASGDAASQYELGDSYCCHGGGPMDNLSVYDNHQATFWYCKAAKQGYGPARAGRYGRDRSRRRADVGEPGGEPGCRGRRRVARRDHGAGNRQGAREGCRAAEELACRAVPVGGSVSRCRPGA